jgi:hypothetical protein
MNKVYKDIDEFLAEMFPSLFNTKKENDKTTIQLYIERTSREFSSEIRKIINGENIA